MNEDSVDVLEFGFQKVTPDGEPIKSKQLKSEYIKTGALEHYLRQGNTTNFLWNKVFRRSVIRDTDFQKLFYSEDAVALANIFARTECYRVIEDKLYKYVISETSACGQKYSLKRLDMLKADREIEKIVRQTDASLIPYAAFNTCVHITKLYVGLSREGMLDPAVKKELKDAFEPNYALVKAEKSVYAMLFRVLVGLYSCVYVAQKNAKKIASTSIAAAVINIVVDLALINLIQVFAASVSSLVAFLSMFVIRYIDVNKTVHICIYCSNGAMAY